MHEHNIFHKYIFISNFIKDLTQVKHNLLIFVNPVLTTSLVKPCHPAFSTSHATLIQNNIPTDPPTPT